MAEQIAAKRPNFYSCSPRVVGGSPCPMVLRDQCRNCSDRLNPPYSALFDRFIPPYSVHPQASAVRMNTGLWPFNYEFCKTLCLGSIPARETIVMTIADGKAGRYSSAIRSSTSRWLARAITVRTKEAKMRHPTTDNEAARLARNRSEARI